MPIDQPRVRSSAMTLMKLLLLQKTQVIRDLFAGGRHEPLLGRTDSVGGYVQDTKIERHFVRMDAALPMPICLLTKTCVWGGGDP